MKKIPDKIRIGLSVVLFFCSICLIVSSIVFSQQGHIWIAYVGPILAILVLAISIILMPKIKRDTSQIVKGNKPTKDKLKKKKKPFISDTEWNEFEEEDDENAILGE